MKNFIKKFTVLIVVLSLLCSVSYGFSDVDVKTEDGMAITKMQNCGYIQGFGDDTFRPNATLTRAEFVTIINKMYGYTLDTENVFSDVNEDDWFFKDVLVGVQAGYIKGNDDGTFSPNAPVTREQVCVMMNRILNVELIPFSQKITDPVSDWAKDSVEKLISNRFFLLEDGGKFRGMQPITRSETCVALEKCIIDVPVKIEPIDLDAMILEELMPKLKGIIVDMETKIIPQFTYDVNRTIADMILTSMNKYIEDPSYDYVSDAKATYEIYRKSGVAATEFKDIIYKNMYLDDIVILFDFFYTPEIDGKD